MWRGTLGSGPSSATIQCEAMYKKLIVVSSLIFEKSTLSWPEWLSSQSVGLRIEGLQVQSLAPAGARAGGNHSPCLSLIDVSPPTKKIKNQQKKYPQVRINNRRAPSPTPGRCSADWQRHRVRVSHSRVSLQRSSLDCGNF